MKKIYFTLLACIFCVASNSAQTLTKAANEPVAGDLQLSTVFDSVNAIPKTTGINQNWNFSSLIQTTATSSSSYIPSSSVPSSSAFTGATLAENQGAGTYNFYKSNNTPSQIEMLGTTTGSADLVFTNSMTYLTWPFSYGNTFTDNFSGSLNSTTISASLNGTNTTNASGTGTLTLPNNLVFTNVLQVKTKQTMVVNFTSPLPFTYSTFITTYTYYHSSNKFPLLSVSYQYGQSPFGNDTTITISVNNAVVLGVTDRNFEATFTIFPNPAKQDFNVELTNSQLEPCRIEIYNSTGELVKSLDFGNSPLIKERVETTGFSTGIYVVKTVLGNKTSSRKLIKE